MSEFIIQIAIVLIIAFILLKINKRIFKHKDKIHLKFIRSFINILIVIVSIVLILNNFEGYKEFSSTILTSSSLLVVVLGFAFQESLTDFIAGIFISLFHPFDIGDRIILKDKNLSGTIEDITIRHTVIRTFTNSRLIIPNSIMNQEIIENNHIIDTRSGNFMDVLVDYQVDLDLAKNIIKECIESHPETIDIDGNEKDYTYVYTREFSENGIWLRANVWTSTIDKNFIVCSEIRESILKEFRKHNMVIPYPQLTITTKK